jgi:hypothetical protein
LLSARMPKRGSGLFAEEVEIYLQNFMLVELSRLSVAGQRWERELLCLILQIRPAIQATVAVIK